MNVKISIIIPIFNAEKFIDRCIQSIIEQKYSNFELILLNDGSTDSTNKILNKYEGVDNRIKIIKKENTGVSDTRNIGIKEANGDYLMFVDADDYIEKNTLESIVNIIKNNDVDLIKYNYNKYDQFNNKLEKQEDYKEYGNRILVKKEIKSFITDILKGKFNAYVWTLVIKKDIIKDIKFNTDISLMEDLLFYINILCTIDTLYVINDRLYNYCMNEDSICNSNRYYYRNFLDMLKIHDLVIDVLKKQNKFDNDEEKNITVSIILAIESVFYRVCIEKNIQYEELNKMITNEKLKDIIDNKEYLKTIPIHRRINIILIKSNSKILLIIYNKLRYQISRLIKNIFRKNEV